MELALLPLNRLHTPPGWRAMDFASLYACSTSLMPSCPVCALALFTMSMRCSCVRFPSVTRTSTGIFAFSGKGMPRLSASLRMAS